MLGNPLPAHQLLRGAADHMSELVDLRVCNVRFIWLGVSSRVVAVANRTSISVVSAAMRGGEPQPAGAPLCTPLRVARTMAPPWQTRRSQQPLATKVSICRDDPDGDRAPVETRHCAQGVPIAGLVMVDIRRALWSEHGAPSEHGDLLVGWPGATL